MAAVRRGHNTNALTVEPAQRGRAIDGKPTLLLSRHKGLITGPKPWDTFTLVVLLVALQQEEQATMLSGPVAAATVVAIRPVASKRAASL